MKSKPTLQESKPVFFLFLFLSTNNECLMFSNDLYKINQLEHFTKKRKTTQNSRDLSIEHTLSGIKPSGKQLKYKQADDRIHRLVSNFSENSNIVEFLRGISHNFTLE